MVTTIFLFKSAEAQWNPMDSVRLSLKNRPRFKLGLDGTHSQVGGMPVNIVGIHYGLDYGKVAFFSGYYTTNITLFQGKDTTYRNYSYVNSSFEYTLFENWRFQIVNSYSIGIGGGKTLLKRQDGSYAYSRGTIYPMQAGLDGTVRFLRYFGFSIGMGVRLSSFDFTGTYYSAGLTYFTGTMYGDYKKWRRKHRQR